MSRAIQQTQIAVEQRGGSRLHWLSILSAWQVLSLITTAQRFAVSGPGDTVFSFLVYLFWSGAVWIYWALVTPLIFWLGRRIPLSRRSLSYALPAHFGLAILFGLLHLAGWAALGALFIKTGGEVHFVSVDEVVWLEADGYCTRIHTGKKAHLLRGNLGGFEAQLDPKKFTRIRDLSDFLAGKPVAGKAPPK